MTFFSRLLKYLHTTLLVSACNDNVHLPMLFDIISKAPIATTHNEVQSELVMNKHMYIVYTYQCIFKN